MLHGIVSSLLYQVPFLLIQAAGMALAVLWWQKHPQLSMLLVVGLGLALLRTGFFEVFLPIVAQVTGHWSLTTVGNRALRILATLISACSYGIIVLAAFYGFREASRPKG